MKELFVFLWSSAPELMSLLVIIGILAFICVKATLFFTEFKQMGVRIERLEQKVDQIIEFLLHERTPLKK